MHSGHLQRCGAERPVTDAQWTLGGCQTNIWKRLRLTDLFFYFNKFQLNFTLISVLDSLLCFDQLVLSFWFLLVSLPG